MPTTGFFGDTDTDDDDDDDDQKTGNKPATDNTSFQELRAHTRQLEKQLKASTKELEDLRTFRIQAEASEKLGKAREYGLTDAQAKAFLKITEGEITPEAVKGFQVEMGLIVPEPETTTETTPQWTTPGFSPLSAGGTLPVRNMLTYQQYKDLLVKDPQAAIKAVAEQRVEDLYINPA